MKNLTIGKKLVAAFTAVATITLILGLVGYRGATKAFVAIEEIGLVRLPSVQSLQELTIAMRTIDAAEEEIASTLTTGEARAHAHQTFAVAKKAADAAWKIYEPLPQTPEEAVEWKKFISLWDKWWKAHEGYVARERAYYAFGVANPAALQRDVAAFRAAHLQLQIDLIDHVLLGRAMPGGDDHTACAYGKWLSAFKTGNAKVQGAFEATKASHQTTHQLVRQAKALAAAGNKDGALRLIQGEFRDAVGQTIANFDSVLQIIEEGNQLIAGMSQAMEEVDACSDPVQQSLAKLVDINQKIAESTTKTAEAQASTQKFVSLTAMIVGASLALGLGIVISRGISLPIRRAAEMLKDISEGEGDLTKRLEVTSHDEIGDMAKYFNNFVEKLQGIVGNLAGNAETVAAAATELSAVSSQTAIAVQSMSEKTSTVAAAAEEASANTTSVAASMEQAATNLASVASATEEMSATVGEIASNSEKARAISEQATIQAQTITSLMQQLGQAAHEIGKVTETITDISSQTNLLALNATIEAARAGAAGKGFAVVANEIKELARQTAAATEDIKAKIAGVQTSTGGAIADIEKIAGVIKEVSAIVSSIAASIEEQAVVTKDVAGNISQASAGVRDSNERIAQTAEVSKSIARDMTGINSAVSDIRQGGDQLQASTTELSELAEQLKATTSQFRV
jgi:methyl-accepting chemotaxis protein